MSFLLLSLYLFCTFIRPQEWAPGLMGKPLINALAVSGFFFLCLEKLVSSKKGFIKVPHNGFMLGLYAATILSHAAHTYVGGMTMAAKGFLVILILYFLVLNSIDSFIKYKVSTWWIVFLICALVFQGMYQVANGVGWAGQYPITQGGKYTDLVTRITWVGIFSDPNDLALTFVIAVGLVLPFIFGRTNFVSFGVSLICAGLLCYGVYLTNSRGGMLALMSTVYYFMVLRTGKLMVGGVIGSVIAAAILVLGPSRVGEISTAEASAYSRVELWYQGFLMLKSNPLFGVGFNMFTDDLPQTAHNSYVLAFGELGFFGFYMWMGLLYCTFKGLNAIQAKVPRLYNYTLGLQSGMVGFCAAGFFLSRTYVIIPYLIFSLTGALLHIARSIDPDFRFVLDKKDMGNIFWLSVGVIVLIFVTIKVAI